MSVLAAGWQQIVSVALYQYRFFVSVHLIAPDLCHDLKVRNDYRRVEKEKEGLLLRETQSDGHIDSAVNRPTGS